MTNAPNDRNHGPQPLDEILGNAGLDNHALVAASPDHLTHKEVAKGRKGRQLTPNLINKITRALNLAMPRDPAWEPRELFTYAEDVRRAWAREDTDA